MPPQQPGRAGSSHGGSNAEQQQEPQRSGQQQGGAASSPQSPRGAQQQPQPWVLMDQQQGLQRHSKGDGAIPDSDDMEGGCAGCMCIGLWRPHPFLDAATKVRRTRTQAAGGGRVRHRRGAVADRFSKVD